MIRNYFFVLLLLASSFACQKQKEEATKTCSETEKLVAAVAWFQRSPEMRVLYKQSYELAKIKLERNLAAMSKSAKNPALVVDIDETVLDNSPFETRSIRTGVAYSSDTWKQWTQIAKAKALPGALGFLNYATEKGVQVFYISNRRTSELQATIKNLKAEGFPTVEEQFVLLRDKGSDKTERRNKVRENYEIILFVGDNLTDLAEKFRDRSINYGFDLVEENWEEISQRFIQLPNPMYGDWMTRLVHDNDLTAQQQDSLIKAQLIGY